MSASRETPIRVGITTGDYNGIGPEIILKTFRDPRMLDACTPVVYGSTRLFSYYKKVLDLENVAYTSAADGNAAEPGALNVVNVWDDEAPIQMGQPTPESGEHAVRSITAAAEALQRGEIDALVTAPIDKANAQGDRFPYPGHTEYFTETFQATNSVMLMVGERLRVGLVTNHLPLSEVPAAITSDGVYAKLRVLYRSLQHDFGIAKPRIAVLGLNPHAGDGGLFGPEDRDAIGLAVRRAQDKKALVYGPYPADGFFGAGQYRHFDAVLAMYHDQGLIPFKALEFGGGVNVTAGLPVVRTSPDHGTGFDIAGQGVANPDSFRKAIFLAMDMVRHRAVHGIAEPV
jgi:4-hydroxythreonine-4-phosphate dehydrogenase